MNKKFYHYSLGFWFNLIEQKKISAAILASAEFMQTYGKGKQLRRNKDE